ncbi:MAG: dehydrogenase [Planctomycetia bacterium]|nr:dehydrogenase [Planctomycetia bacterium]
MSATIDRPAAGSPGEPIFETRTLLGLYEQMMLIRRFELTAQDVYKKGEMPGFIHLYLGEEATAVGVCAHLRRDDWITSTHRGHGHALAKGVPPEEVLAELYGKAGGCCGGRGGSMHLYKLDVGLFGTNGFVGGGLPATVGLGLSARTRATDQVAVAFFGDGAVNHGAFHESLNFAGVQKLPVVFVCENNHYATATPLTMATLNTDVATKAAAYGIPGVAVDGNDVLAVWEVTRQAVQRARSGGGPTLIEAKTYRVVGHHEGDPLTGTYRSQEELDTWRARCPIATFRKKLLAEGRATAEQLDKIDGEVEAKILHAVEFSRKSPAPDPACANDHVWAEPLHPRVASAPANAETKVQSWLEAVRDGIAEEMRRDRHIVYLGEGTGERGGSFAHTKNLWHEFGAERMIDTPICELGFTGAAAGAAASGCRAVADVMFADFMFEAASQIIEQAAKLRYMSNGQTSVPMIVRAAWGTIKNTGPHHSGSYHPIWAHCPGLIVVIPSTPADAKGLFKTALRAHDPVIFFEPKALFSSKGPVPVGEHFVPFGVANIVRAGTDLTIVSCGSPVHRCLDAAEQLEQHGISCEIVDLRTIVPLDVETVIRSVAKTGHLLVVDEAFSMCGIGAELAAVMMEHAFEKLDAPVGRLHTDPVGHPFSPAHENAVVVSVEKIISAAKAVMAGRPEIPRRLRATVAKKSAAAPLRRSVGAPPAKFPRPAPTADASSVPLVMPNQDLTINEARIIQWLKQVGDPVAKDEPVVEVETDKAVMTVDAPVAGHLAEILVSPTTVVLLGQRLGTIRRDD